MTEDSSSHWPTKRRHVYYETSGRAGLEFVCVFGRDGSAKDAVASYIEGFYNPHRLHSSRGYVSPMLFEQLYALKSADAR